jgi:hypothetical protein
MLMSYIRLYPVYMFYQFPNDVRIADRKLVVAICHSDWLYSRKYGTVWYHPTSSRFYLTFFLSFVSFRENWLARFRILTLGPRVLSQLIWLAMCLAWGADCTSTSPLHPPFLPLGELPAPLDLGAVRALLAPLPTPLEPTRSFVSLNHLTPHRILSNQSCHRRAPPYPLADDLPDRSTNMNRSVVRSITHVCRLSPLPGPTSPAASSFRHQGHSCERFWSEGISVKLKTFQDSFAIRFYPFVSSDRCLVKFVEIHKKIRKM